MAKNNDFIVASITNPNFDSSMFQVAGLNSTNTQMLDKETYEKSPFIQQLSMFQDDSGNFSKLKFEDFYNLKLNDWNSFSLTSNTTPELQYDLFDYRRFSKPNSKVKNVGLKFDKISNPFEETIGLGWLNERVESPLSVRELALKNKVIDYETGEERDYSPNDHALFEHPIEWFKDIFREPLVLATYDEDTIETDPITGEKVQKSKGDYKLNKEGKLYYENLGGRNTKNKDILSKFDTLTVDGSAFNKVDVFDSDDKETNIAKTIAKSAIEIAPMLISGPVGLAYDGYMVGKEILKALPMLDGYLGTITNSDTPFTRLANNLSAIGSSFDTSMTDEGRSGGFSFESLAKTIKDVALLLGLQTFVANTFRKLSNPEKIIQDAETTASKLYDARVAQLTATVNREIEELRAAGKMAEAELAAAKLVEQVGTKEAWKDSIIGSGLLRESMNNAYKVIDKNNKLASQLSLMYMVGISNTDVFQDSLDAGLTKREAAAVTLGSLLGMYGVDAKLHLGEHMFSWLTPENEKAARNTLRNSAKDWITELSKDVKDKESKEGMRKLFRGAMQKSASTFSNFWDLVQHHSGGLMVNAISEGMEEVGEEVSTDLSKQLYQWASEIAPNFLDKKDLGAWENMGERYLQNFVGGALGGGIFYGVEAFKGGHPLHDDTRDKLIYLYNNNDKLTVDRILNEMHEKGQLGSKDLGYKAVQNENGNYTFLTADENNISQNDFVYNQLKNELDGIYGIIKDADLLMSDGQLYDGLTLGDMRLMRLAQVLKENNEDFLKDYIQRYHKLVSDYVGKNQQIKDVTAELPDNATAELKQLNALKVKALLDLLTNIKEQIDLFKSGENAIDYTGRMLFQMDERLSEPFSSIVTFKSFLRNEHTLEPEDFERLDDAQKKTLVDEYLEKKETRHNDIELAWQLFKDIRDLLSPEFVNILDKAKDLRQYIKDLLDIVDPKKNPLNNIKDVSLDLLTEDSETPEYKIDYSSLLQGESPADYAKALRDSDDDFETPEEHAKFREERLNKLKLLKQVELHKKAEIEAFKLIELSLLNSGGVLDKTTRRHLLLTLGVRLKDILDDWLGKSNTEGLFTLSPATYLSVIKELKPDLSNLEDIKKLLKEKLIEPIKEKANLYLTILNTLNNLDSYSGNNLFEKLGKLTGADILKFIKDEVDSRAQARENLVNLNFIDENNNLDKAQMLAAGIDPEKSYKENKNILKGLGFTDSLISLLISKNRDKTKIFDKFEEFVPEVSSKERDNFIIDILSLSDLDRDIIRKIFNESDESTGEINYDKIADELNGVTNGFNLGEIVDGNTYQAIADGSIPENTEYFKNLEIEQSTDPTKSYQGKFKAIDLKLDFIKNLVLSNEVWKYIKAINDAVAHPKENPIIGIIKKIGLSLNKDTSDVEALLDKLMSTMDRKGAKDFTLTNEERKALDEAYDFLELAKSFIYSTFNSKSTVYPYPHNQLINQLRALNGFEGDDLPVIDDDVAELYYGLMQALLDEIGYKTKNGYNVGSWRWWDARNQVNKSRMFIDADNAFTSATRLRYWNDYKTNLTGTVRGISFNLLEGYDDIVSKYSKEDERLFAIELLFSNNINKLLSEHPELTLKEIFNECGINEFFFSDLENLVQLATAEINENIDSTKLTPMDKALYLISLTCLSPDLYIKELRKSLSFTDTAPLSVLQYVGRLGISYARNTKRFNEGLDWIYSNLDSDNIGKLQLIYGLFITGNGGAGKTSVVLRDIVNSISDSENNKALVAEPTGELLKSLDKLPSNSEKHTKLELFRLILDDSLITTGSDTLAIDIPADYKQTKSGFLEDYTTVIPEKIKDKFKKVEKLGMIAIDEATHYSTLELSILSEYCKLNNIPLIMIGDDYLNGYTKGNNPENINIENVFTARSPRIAITLRDGNYLKLENNNTLAYLVRRTLFTPTDNSIRPTYILDSISAFKLFKLLSYDGTVINGDLITKKITDEQYAKLKALDKDKTIGFLGDENSDRAKELKAKLPGRDIVFMSTPVEMQGREFDVMICDYNIPKVELETGTYTQRDESLKLFLKLFYTISTRGKEATIFFDNNDLGKTINIESQSYQNSQTNFNAEAIKRFSDMSKDYLDRVEKIPGQIGVAPVTTTTATSSTETPHLSEGECNTPLADASDEDKKVAESLDDKATNDEESAVATSENELLDDDGTAMLGYGDFSLRGVPVDNDGNWVLDDSQELVSDCGIFMKPGELILSGELKDNIVEKLLATKCGILFENEEKDFPPEFVRKYDLNSVKYKIIASPRDENIDLFVGYSELDSKQMEINGGDGRTPLVYRVVAEFLPKVDTDGKTPVAKPCRITLGGLANPDTYDKSTLKLLDIREKLLSRLKYLNELKHKTSKDSRDITKISERIARLDTLIVNRPNLAKEYRKQINQVYNNYINGLTETEISDIQFTGNSEIRTIMRGKYNIPKVRLSGFINNIMSIINGNANESSDKQAERLLSQWFLDALQLEKLTTWVKHNPYVRFSDVYIVNLSESENTDVYAGGKAVIFVSTNTALDTDKKLIDRYVYEKNKPGKHSVRMIHLDNMGCSLANLCDSHAFGFIAETRTEGGKGFNKFPADTRYMGMRMLLGLWNFRANLLNYKAIYEANKTSIFGNASDADIEAMLKEMYSLYKEYLKDKITDENPTLTRLQEVDFYKWAEDKVDSGGYKLTKNIVSLINEFNSNIAQGAKLFRLGVGGNDNGWIIRKLLLKDGNTNYDTSKDNYGIYLSPATMYNFLGMLDTLWNQLDLVFVLNKVSSDNKEQVLIPYKSNEFIEINGNATPRYQITSILTKLNSEFVLESDSKTLDASLIKFLPKIITQAVSRAIAYSKTKERTAGDGTVERYLSAEDDATKRPYKTRTDDSVWDWKRAANIIFNEIDINDKKHPIEHRINVLSLVLLGEKFAKMMELIFHGTTDDFIQAIDSHKFIPLATDAYFKYGFLIDPYTKIGENWITIDGIGKLKKSQTNLGFFGIKCAITLPTFRIKLNGKFATDSNISQDRIDEESEIETTDDDFNYADYESKVDMINDPYTLQQLSIGKTLASENMFGTLEGLHCEFKRGLLVIANEKGYVTYDPDEGTFGEFKKFILASDNILNVVNDFGKLVGNTYILDEKNNPDLSKSGIEHWELLEYYRQILKNGSSKNKILSLKDELKLLKSGNNWEELRLKYPGQEDSDIFIAEILNYIKRINEVIQLFSKEKYPDEDYDDIIIDDFDYLEKLTEIDDIISLNEQRFCNIITGK